MNNIILPNIKGIDEFVAFSDIQFYKNMSKAYITESGNSSWLLLQTKATHQIFDYCIENKIKVVLHTGDLFEEKSRIPQDLYNYVWQLFYDFSDRLTFIFNTGNHDILTFTRKSSLKPFSPFITIITEPTDIEFKNTTLRIIPYGMVIDYPCTNENISQIPSNNKIHCLATHEDIDGLVYGANDYKNSERLSSTIFKEWNYVLNGHIHKPQIVGNIVNIGSPLIQDFSEEEDQKYFIHYKEGEIKRIPLNIIKFLTLDKLNGKIKKQLEEDNENFYRIKVSSEEVSDPIFKKYNVSPLVVKQKKREIRLKTESTLEDEIKTYVEITETNLNKERLINVGNQLTKGE